MHPFGPVAIWLLTGASLALFLVAAKTHGRHLRLERDLEGYAEVEFGSDRNPAWVQSLWRIDRNRFWTLVPVYAGLLVALHLFLEAGVAPHIFDVGGPVGHGLIVVLLLAPALAFLTNGAFSWRRAERRLHEPSGDKQTAARRAAYPKSRPGTWGLWLTAAALAVLVVVAGHA